MKTPGRVNDRAADFQFQFLASPTERHVRFDGSLSLVQIGAGVEHVESNRVDFVAVSAGEAVASHVARLGIASDTQQPLRDHLNIARAFGQADDVFAGVMLLRHLSRLLLRIGPADHDVGVGFNFVQGHDSDSFEKLAAKSSEWF